jgi:hypothetical protein
MGSCNYSRFLKLPIGDYFDHRTDAPVGSIWETIQPRRRMSASGGKADNMCSG